MTNQADSSLESCLRKSFRGSLDSISIELPISDSTSSSNADPVDLVKMARWSLHYLINNPRPYLDYEPVFHIFGFNCLPTPEGHDPIVEGDTESRMDWEYMYMRDIYPTDEGLEVQAAIRRRILGYLGEDGLCWLSAACLYCPPDMKAANFWATTKLAVSLIETYYRTGDLEQLKTARKCLDGLASLASWKGNAAYYEGGGSPWTPEHGWLTEGAFSQYDPPLSYPFLKYWEATGDDKMLDLAVAFADGVLVNAMGKRERVFDWTGTEIFDPQFKEDGSFSGHVHLHGKTTWGIAEVGRVTGEKRFIDFAKRVCDFMISVGTDYGWVPEYMWNMWDSSHSETCAVGDLVSISTNLAKCGYTSYWDVVERTIRNYISETQFFVTGAYQEMYRNIHHDLPKEQVEKGLDIMRRMQGACMGSVNPNDMDIGPIVLKGELRRGLDMMGCCPPEGMRAIYTAWSNIVSEDGSNVYINLSFNRNHAAAQVISYLPNDGRLAVVAKKAGTFSLRPPSMIPQEMVEARRNGTPAPTQWAGDYVRFDGVKPGEKLEISYPLVSFKQKFSVGVGDYAKEYTASWKGSTVVDIDPRGKTWPIFVRSGIFAG